MNLRIIRNDKGICYVEGIHFDENGSPMLMEETGLEICTATLGDMHSLIFELAAMLYYTPEPIEESEIGS